MSDDAVPVPEVVPALPAEHARQVRGSTLLLGGRVLSLVFTISTQVLLVRALSKEDFGALALALAVASGGRLLLGLGQAPALSRFVSQYEREGERARAVGVLVLAITTVFATTLLMAVLFAAFGPGLLDGVVPAGAWQAFLLLLLLAPLEAVDAVLVSWFAVRSRARTIVLRKYILTPALRLATVLVLIALDADLLLLAGGYLLATMVGLAFVGSLLASDVRAAGGLRAPRGAGVPVGVVLRFGLGMLTSELLALSMTTGSVVLLTALQDVAAVADYRAMFPVARLNTFAFATFSVLMLPAVSRLFSAGDTAGLRFLYARTAALMAVITFPVLAMTVPFAGTTAVLLFGDRYADSADVLWILALGSYVNIALGFNAMVLQVSGHLSRVVAVNVVAASVNIALGLLLVPQYGAVGVAAGNAVVLLLQNAALQVALGRGFTVTLLREVGTVYLGIAVAGGVLGVVAHFFEPTAPAAVLLSLLASVAVLVASRRALRVLDTFPELGRVRPGAPAALRRRTRERTAAAAVPGR